MRSEMLGHQLRHRDRVIVSKENKWGARGPPARVSIRGKARDPPCEPPHGVGPIPDRRVDRGRIGFGSVGDYQHLEDARPYVLPIVPIEHPLQNSMVAKRRQDDAELRLIRSGQLVLGHTLRIARTD